MVNIYFAAITDVICILVAAAVAAGIGYIILCIGELIVARQGSKY